MDSRSEWLVELVHQILRQSDQYNRTINSVWLSSKCTITITVQSWNVSTHIPKRFTLAKTLLTSEHSATFESILYVAFPHAIKPQKVELA